MKKVSKFRAWLIRKLGGEIPIPTKPVVIERTPPSVILESKVSITYDMLNWYKYMGGEKRIKKKLWEELFEQASPCMVVLCHDNPQEMVLECKARLTVLKEQQNG